MKKQVKKEKKSLKKFIELGIGVGVLVIIGALSIFGILETLELASFDLLMHAKPATEERDDIVIASIDDASIEAIGTYPWPRNIMGNAIMRMRELGANQVIFDIEFLDPSTKGLTADADKQLDNLFTESTKSVSDMLLELSTTLENGYWPVEDASDLAQEFIQYYVPESFTILDQGIKNEIFFDFDEYFSQCLKMFGNAWLTINASDLGINIDEDLESYVRANFLLNKVTDAKGYIREENDTMLHNRGMTPAIEPLMKSSAGAGFTNIILDSDGARRRLQLLHENEGQYIAQLVFAPLLSILDTQTLVREKHTLIIKDALFPEEETRRDVKIPLDKNGCLIINWIPDTFNESFKNESLLFLLNLDEVETALINFLNQIASFRVGNSSNVSTANYLLDSYVELESTKESLLADTSVKNSREDSRFDEYFANRVAFFEMCSELTDPYYTDEIYSILEEGLEDVNQINAIKKDVKEMFANYTDQLNLYNELFAETKDSYNEAFVIVGHTATGSTDLGTTPFEGHYANVGTHANVYNTIMNEDFITPLPDYISYILAAILVFFYIWASKKTASHIRHLIGALLLLAVPAIAVILIQFNIYIPFVVATFLSIALTYVGTTLWNFFSAEADKKFLRSTFGTFLSDKVVEKIVSSGKPPELGGENYTITALFSDIKGFSSFSEKLTPTELVYVLNKYLSALSNEILANDGTVDKYIGDAIVAMFGAPEAMDDHAYKACVSAIKMKQAEVIVNEELKEINEKLIADGKTPMKIETRIGLNSGDVVAGLMGTEKMKNYTMMGDNVNLAARLESGVKKYEEWIMISENTWDAANSGENEGKLVVRRLDKVRVVGRSTPVQLFNLMGFKAELSKEILEMIDIFEEALDLCNTSILEQDSKKLSHAKERFYDALALNPEDGPTKVFIARCDDFMAKGFPKDWDGVINWTSK